MKRRGLLAATAPAGACSRTSLLQAPRPSHFQAQFIDGCFVTAWSWASLVPWFSSLHCTSPCCAALLGERHHICSWASLHRPGWDLGSAWGKTSPRGPSAVDGVIPEEDLDLLALKSLLKESSFHRQTSGIWLPKLKQPFNSSVPTGFECPFPQLSQKPLSQTQPEESPIQTTSQRRQ